LKIKLEITDSLLYNVQHQIKKQLGETKMKMTNLLKAAALAMAATLIVGCGQRVEVPPGFVGKIMTKDGYQEGLIPTSKLRLPPCINYCDRMVLLDNTDKSYVEPMEIFIPGDKLNITVDLRATLSVDPQKADALFNKLPQTVKSDQESVITAAKPSEA